MALDLVFAATGIGEPPTVWLAHSSLMLPSVDDIIEAEDSCASSWRGLVVLDGGTQNTEADF